MSKRNTSGVWNFFTIQADSAHLATCDICSATMKRGKPGGNKKSFQVTSLYPIQQASLAPLLLLILLDISQLKFELEHKLKTSKI